MDFGESRGGGGIFSAGEIDGGAAGVGDQPIGDVGGGSEGGEFGESLDEGFLGNVLGGMVIAEDAPGDGVDLALVAASGISFGINLAAGSARTSAMSWASGCDG